MKVAHLLRKYNPIEWGGTETAIHRLFLGLREQDVQSVVYCPSISANRAADPLAEAGCAVKRFRACVPIWGLPADQKRQMIAVGGNLMSFDLIQSLFRENNLSLIHSHALGRVGGIGMTVARRRGIPFVVSVHGGAYDLPESLRKSFNESTYKGWEWGKLFGLLLKARRVLTDADAIVVCNPKEASLIRENHPGKRVLVQPHGVPAALYSKNQQSAARQAFPGIEGRQVLLSLGRIDPVKNQGWLVEQMPKVVEKYPKALLVLAGSCTDKLYGEQLSARIAELGLGKHVLLTGSLPPGDPKLIGLMQEAALVFLPSISETFGLVILEAWAAGTPVLASFTSGANALIEQGKNSWQFDLKNPATFHQVLDESLPHPDLRKRCAEAGKQKVIAEYDTTVLAGRIRILYETLTEEKNALRYNQRR